MYIQTLAYFLYCIIILCSYFYEIILQVSTHMLFSNFQVCELHFQQHEIERLDTVWDEKSGRMLSATLLCPRLISGKN